MPAGYTMTAETKDGLTTITNTYGTGAMVITKTFCENVADLEAIDDLQFTVTGPDDYTLTVSYSEFTDGKYQIDDLVPGFYAVAEENAFGLITNYTLNVETSKISGTSMSRPARSAEPPLCWPARPSRWS